MSKLKIPCAVKIKGLSKEQVNILFDKFLELGVEEQESPRNFRYSLWKYYGVKYDNTTYFQDTLYYFAEDSEKVTLYTYEEVMALSNSSEPSSESITDTLNNQATLVLPEANNVSTTSVDTSDEGYGATVKIQIELRLGEHNESLVVSRDQAYKLWRDLTNVFETEII